MQGDQATVPQQWQWVASRVPIRLERAVTNIGKPVQGRCDVTCPDIATALNKPSKQLRLSEPSITVYYKTCPKEQSDSTATADDIPSWPQQHGHGLHRFPRSTQQCCAGWIRRDGAVMEEERVNLKLEKGRRRY